MSCGYGVFCGQLPAQVVYQTNADYYASEEALSKNTLVFLNSTKKGLLWFRFLGSKTVFQLSPLGKLQVMWSDLSEKKTLYKLVKNLLVVKGNEKLLIRPLRQQTWIEYPVPESFKLYWCDVATEYVLKTNPAKQEEKIESPKTEVEVFRTNLSNLKKLLIELRCELMFFREPKFSEIAFRFSCVSTDDLRRFLCLTNWEAPSMEDDERSAKDALNLAGWLHYKERGEPNSFFQLMHDDAIKAASKKVIDKAQHILRNYPCLVPEVGLKRLMWPDETKTKWTEAFGSDPPAEVCWKIIFLSNQPTTTKTID